jgi:replication factor A1
MEPIPEVAERISRKIESEGVSVDREKVIKKLQLLISEFAIPVEEAERTVFNELVREYNLGSSSPQKPEHIEIRDLAPGEWVTVEGKIVSLSQLPTQAVAQSGIIADSSGAVQFVVWAKAGAPVLEERRWYRFEAAVVDEYRGAPSLKIHSGTKISLLEDDRALVPSIQPIAELKPGVGSVRAKIVQEWEPRHERMLQTGLLGDESGIIKFVLWKDGEKEKLEPGVVYSIYYASVDEFMGRLSLNLSTAMYLPEEGDITVHDGSITLSGAFVHLGSGSGLIKRCPVEGCNRALSRQNYCPVHEIQTKFRYDLRITGVIDDGRTARNVLIQRENSEQLSGMSLDEAIEVAENNPLGFDDVFLKMRNAIIGRYIRCSGSDIDGTLLIKECKKLRCDPSRHVELINRAASAQKEVGA